MIGCGMPTFAVITGGASGIGRALAHRVAAIDHGQRAGIDDQLRLGNGGADARPQSGKVPRQAQDTVRLVAPEIGLDQRVGDEPRVRFRHAGGDVNRR